MYFAMLPLTWFRWWLVGQAILSLKVFERLKSATNAKNLCSELSHRMPRKCEKTIVNQTAEVASRSKTTNYL